MCPSLSWEEVGPFRGGGWPFELGSALWVWVGTSFSWVGVGPSGRATDPKEEKARPNPKGGLKLGWPFLLGVGVGLSSFGLELSSFVWFLS